MSELNISFFSQSLLRPVSFRVILPNDQYWDGQEYYEDDFRTLFLLHGYRMGPTDFFAADTARHHRTALVMPNGDDSFYLDAEPSDCKYCTYIGKELPDFIRKTLGLARKREDTFIAGVSMGGFGALHTALAYPETFGKTAALSSALIVHGIAHMKEGTDNGVANYAYYRRCFGDLETVEESTANPETLVKTLISEKKQLPDIYMACGTEDFLLNENRAFHAFLTENGVQHDYHESKGVHDMNFWAEYMPKAIEWMMR